MAFYGSYFSFDGKSSETYGLKLGNIDVNGINRSMGQASLEIKEQSIWRRNKPYFLGSTLNSKLSFPMSAFSETKIDQDSFEAIQAWLFSSRTYKVLTIDQPDMYDVYFECINNQSEGVRAGNEIVGLGWQVVCSTPYALKFPKTTTYSFSSPSGVVKTFLNLSHDTDSYLYPTSMTITMDSSGGNVSIINLDDANREVSFTGLLSNEVLTINPQNQTITSSTGLRRLALSNKKFLRLKNGQNRLQVSGHPASISLVTQFVSKKLGG